jgi:hypothetical protein
MAELHLSGVRSHHRQNARCRIDGSLYQCYSDGGPLRAIDPGNRGIGVDRRRHLLGGKQHDQL